MENMMNKLQNPVAHPKTNKNVYSRTLSGGVITLASSIIMLLLFSEGGDILTLAEIYQLLARKLSGKVFLEAVNYQPKRDLVEIVKNLNQQLLWNYKKRPGVWGSVADN